MLASRSRLFYFFESFEVVELARSLSLVTDKGLMADVSF